MNEMAGAAGQLLPNFLIAWMRMLEQGFDTSARAVGGARNG
jgi:hypothetical protein